MPKFISLSTVMIVVSCCILSNDVSALDLGLCGASGGRGGHLFDDGASISDNLEISKVIVWYGQLVDAIQVIYRDRTTGNEVLQGRKHGGSEGRPYPFELKRGEYIVGVTGRHGEMIDSIQFVTNTGTRSIVMGGSGGDTEFYYYTPSGIEIIGFRGRSGQYIDAIGVYFRHR